jgi:hypothetical protein
LDQDQEVDRLVTREEEGEDCSLGFQKVLGVEEVQMVEVASELRVGLEVGNQLGESLEADQIAKGVMDQRVQDRLPGWVGAGALAAVENYLHLGSKIGFAD